MEDGTQIALDGTLFLPAKHYSRSEDGSVVEFFVNESAFPAVPSPLAAFSRPIITLPAANVSLLEGVSFPSIDLFLSQPHFPLSLSRALPASVSLVPRRDGRGGYRIAGIWTGAGTFEIILSARNSRGGDTNRLRVSVQRTDRAFR